MENLMVWTIIAAAALWGVVRLGVRCVMTVRVLGVSFAAVLAAMPVAAGAEEAESGRIRDNLFLLEEAYNQEPGVIQHISVFQYVPRATQWAYSFTEEWPVPTDLNQLSVTLNLAGGPGEGSTGLADALLNYRLQALGLGGNGWIAMAPRLSLVLPTGSAKNGMGRGGIGIQLNLPVSVELGRYFVLHLNAGATLTPSAQSPGGRTETALDTNAGMAVVWQPLKWLNALVEVSHAWTEELADAGSDRVSTLVVNPGLRFAIDHRASGLQVVPGFSAPMQVLPKGELEVGVLTYLSFEHPAF
jgi:hypothetical protein